MWSLRESVYRVLKERAFLNTMPSLDSHVLNHVLVDHLSPDLRGHGQFDKGDLGRSQPAQQAPVKGMVSEGDQVAQLPEDGASETVVVVSDRDILVEGALVRQRFLHVQVVPGLPKMVDAVHFPPLL